MNQKLSNWASVAEIASGIAVIVTLIILILGVRQNTESVRASAYADNSNSLNQFQTQVLTDPDALRVWNAFVSQDMENLDELDRQRRTLMVLTLFRVYENAYLFERRGFLGNDEWERFERNICFWFERVKPTQSLVALRDTMTTGFFDYVSESCSN